MPREGPCAVRAVVDGVTKCHDMLGTTKRYFEASADGSFAGLETCDAYQCKKDGGVKVEEDRFAQACR